MGVKRKAASDTDSGAGEAAKVRKKVPGAAAAAAGDNNKGTRTTSQAFEKPNSGGKSPTAIGKKDRQDRAGRGPKDRKIKGVDKKSNSKKKSDEGTFGKGFKKGPKVTSATAAAADKRGKGKVAPGGPPKKGGKVVAMNSKEKRENQKKLRLKRRAEGSDVFELGVKAKQIWEDLRQHHHRHQGRGQDAGKVDAGDDDDNDAGKVSKLAGELHALIKGKIGKIIHAHDTVRVVECLTAVGSPEVRNSLYEELKDDLVGLAKSKYASFFVQKLLRYGTKEQKARVVKTFEGRIVELTKHKVANAVVETCFNDVANAAQRNRMVQEFFGPEFRLCKDEGLRTVLDLLKRHPDKEKTVARDLQENCNILLTKGCYNVSIVHTVLYNQMLLLNDQVARWSSKAGQQQPDGEAGGGGDGDDEGRAAKARKARSEFVAQLREVCVHVLHSQDGARLTMNALWHGSAKDRKAVLKSFKTFVPKICSEEHGHLVLLAAFDCVDDTKLLAKAIVGEMMASSTLSKAPAAVDEEEEEEDKAAASAQVSGWGSVAALASEQGKKVLTYLLAGRDTTHFHPDYLKLLQQGDANESSKKDEATRRRELRQSVAPALLKLFADGSNLADFLEADRRNSLFIQALLCRGGGGDDLELRHAVASKMAQFAAAGVSGPEGQAVEDNFLESSAGHRLLKKIIGLDKEAVSGDNVAFSELLMDELAKRPGAVKRCLFCNRGLFLFVAIAETDVPRLKERLADLLKGHADLLESQTTTGAAILKTKLAKRE